MMWKHRLPSWARDMLPDMGSEPIDTTPPERLKARTLVQAVEDATHACLIEQGHLMGWQTAERQVALDQLAHSFIETDWCPDGLTRADIEHIGFALIADVVWCVSIGRGLSAIEAKIHAAFQDVPAVRESSPRRPISRLNPRPRRHV